MVICKGGFQNLPLPGLRASSQNPGSSEASSDRPLTVRGERCHVRVSVGAETRPQPPSVRALHHQQRVRMGGLWASCVDSP